MKKIVRLFCMLLIGLTAFAQDPKTQEIYDFKGIQLNHLWQNEKSFTLADIPSDTPILLFVFSPDCGHCRLDAPKMATLAPQYNVPIWMASSRAKEDVLQFGKEFKLDQVKGLHLLHDSSNKLHDWFNFRYVPFIALIDNKGNFIKEFEKLPSPAELSEMIRTHQFLESYHK